MGHNQPAKGARRERELAQEWGLKTATLGQEPGRLFEVLVKPSGLALCPVFGPSLAAGEPPKLPVSFLSAALARQGESGEEDT